MLAATSPLDGASAHLAVGRLGVGCAPGEGDFLDGRANQRGVLLRRRLFVIRCLGVAFLGALVVGAGAGLAWARVQSSGTGPGEPLPTLVGLSANVIAAPTPVLGTDKRRHLVYEISLLNVAASGERIDRVQVLDAADRSVIASYDGAGAVRKIMSNAAQLHQPTDELPSSGGGVLWLDVSFPRGARIPRRLVHRIEFTELSRPAGRETVNGARTMVSSRGPVVLGPPLLGARYLDTNGCCGESAHTRALLPIDGRRYLAQRYATDWLRLDRHGRSRVGDPSKNESYVIFGDPVIAAASGVVIDTRNDLPENTPPHPLANLNVQNVLGNQVTEALGGGRYAAYAHLQPGSVAVHVGQRVHRGELLGRVGNTGSSTAAHLHFQVTDGPNPVISNGQSYVFARFALTGEAVGFDKATDQFDIGPAAAPLVRRDQLALERDEVTFPPGGAPLSG
jgi:Peptidase family M23